MIRKGPRGGAGRAGCRRQSLGRFRSLRRSISRLGGQGLAAARGARGLGCLGRRGRGQIGGCFGSRVASDERGKFGLTFRRAAAVLTRTVRANPIFPRAIFTGAVLTGPVVTGPIFTRAVVTGALIARSVIARPIFTPIFAGAVITAILAPIVAALVARAVVPVAILAARLRLRLAMVRARFGQIDQISLIIAAQNPKGFGPISALDRLIAAIIAAILTVPLVMAIATLPATLLLARLLLSRLFAHRLGQKPGVMLGMLQEVFRGHAVIRQLGITCQKLIFFNDLLRRAAHLAFGARAVEDTVDDIAERARAVLLGTRARLGRAHLVL